MRQRGKLLRKTKRKGRCIVHGHGCTCEVALEMQSKEYHRGTETNEVRKSICFEISESKQEGYKSWDQYSLKVKSNY